MIKKTDFNLKLLTCLFSTALVTSNVVTARMLSTNINLFGSSVVLPGACICYWVTYLITDVINEIWGAKEANETVKIGMFAQILSTVLIVLTGFMPTTTEEIINSYNVILGQNIVFVIGSLTAYLISQTVDVKLFNILRNKFSKQKWIRNNLSTMTSQAIDTIIFITISFGLGMGWLFHKNTLITLIFMILGQYIFKFCLAIFDTPFFYLFTYKNKKTNY